MLAAYSSRGAWRVKAFTQVMSLGRNTHGAQAHRRMLSVGSFMDYLIRHQDGSRKRTRSGMQGLSELVETQNLPLKGATFDLKTEVTSPPKLDVVFLGTCAMTPSLTRNVSSILVKFGSTSWLFDCGDGTQQQMMRGNLNPGKISRVFISHFHGDHLFGLPGLICSMNPSKEQAEVSPKIPLEIYGPPGLREWLRLTLSLSGASLNFKYKVHELHAYSDLHDEQLSNATLLNCELPGNNLVPDECGVWSNLSSQNQDLDIVCVHAALLKHRAQMPTFGFVLKETDYPGTVNAKVVMERFENERNKPYLRQMGGPGLPGKLVGDLKRGETVELADGVLRPEECLGPTKRGRKVAILSDTCDPSNIASLCAGATLVVHEATECNLPTLVRPMDVPKPYDSAQVKRRGTKRAYSRGHSTPEMAATFAQAVEAEALALTHFSGRHHGYTNSSFEQERSHAFTEAIQKLAGESYDGQVVVAHDLLMLEVRAEWAKDWKEGAVTARRSYDRYRPWSPAPEMIIPASIYSKGEKPFDGEITAEEAALGFAKACGRIENTRAKSDSVDEGRNADIDTKPFIVSIQSPNKPCTEMPQEPT